MTMAAHMQSAEIESVGATEGSCWRDDILREEGKALGGLECRTGRILSHDTAVEQGFRGVGAQSAVVLAPRPSHHYARVVVGRRHHAQHLARRRLDGHNTAYLALHQPLAKGLKVVVDGECEVFAWHGALVESSVLIAALDSSMGVAQQYLHSLLATELLFVFPFHTKFSDIVSRLIVFVFLYVGRRHLCHITQHMCCHGILVLTYASALDIDTRESEHLLVENAEVLVGQLAHEELLGEAGVSGIL